MWISNIFDEASLTKQFAVAGGLVMLVAMLVAGTLVSRMVVRESVENTAASTAVFVGSFIAPLVQELATSNQIVAYRDELEQLLNHTEFAKRFPHMEIWKAGGLIAYSKAPGLTGASFPPPDGLIRALKGEVVSTYTDLNASEHTIRDFRNRFLEVYVPLRDYETGAIVAVAEIHETTEPLERNLRWLRIEAWFAVVALALLIMLSLFGIVRRASGLIGRQRASLIEQMDALREASDQNAALRERVQQASIRASAANENHLRQVGAELHDGPAQLIGLAALKVDMVRQAGKVARDEILSSLSAILKEALRDIRTISKGLMLPEIAGLPLDEVVRRVCRVHEQRTGTIVDMDCGATGCGVSHAIKICVYRFIQEGLNNAFRHAGGIGQSVRCRCDSGSLLVSVSDRGAGGPHSAEEREVGLGLTGLRERVESLGGVLDIRPAAIGMTITMKISLPGGECNA